MSRVEDWRSQFNSLGIRGSGMNGFTPVTAKEMEALSALCGAAKFPPLFVEMATSLGNISFENLVSVAGLSGESFVVWGFYGGAPSDLTLVGVHELFVEKTGLPSYWVPFAYDFHGQEYVFDSRDVLGPVFIDIDGLIPVSNSFDEFIGSLRIDSAFE